MIIERAQPGKGLKPPDPTNVVKQPTKVLKAIDQDDSNKNKLNMYVHEELHIERVFIKKFANNTSADPTKGKELSEHLTLNNCSCSDRD